MNAFASPLEASHSKGSPPAPRRDSRGSSRREVLLPCQVVREHDFVLLADRTLDISIEGLFVPLRRRALTGESLVVSFAIPGMWIDAEATVARVVHGRRPGDDGLAAGVLFHRLAPAARAALAGFLHGRHPPLPRRGPLARVRRGQEAPRLADELVMQHGWMPAISSDTWTLAPEEAGDVTDVTEEAVEVDDAVDGLGVLRAVVDAWHGLLVPDGAANAES